MHLSLQLQLVGGMSLLGLLLVLLRSSNSSIFAERKGFQVGEENPVTVACRTCKSGETAVSSPFGCNAYCSPAGYCGHSPAYQQIGSFDCAAHGEAVSNFKQQERKSVVVPLQVGACRKELFLGGEKYGAGAEGQLHLDSASEGGWGVCDDQFGHTREVGRRGPCIVYSMGVNDDWSFDKAASDEHGCMTHGFDPSPAGLASQTAYTQGSVLRQYHTWGVGPEDKEYGIGQVPFRWPGIGYLSLKNDRPWTLKTVSSTMATLDHKAITVLKMDVEGAEWFVIEDLVKHKIIENGKVEQFDVELHFDPLKYRVRADGPSKGFSVTQIAPDDMDYIGMLTTLVHQGLTMWKWKFNSYDHNCVEVCFIVRSVAQIDV
jgi:hypothetical protein